MRDCFNYITLLIAFLPHSKNHSVRKFFLKVILHCSTRFQQTDEYRSQMPNPWPGYGIFTRGRLSDSRTRKIVEIGCRYSINLGVFQVCLWLTQFPQTFWRYPACRVELGKRWSPIWIMPVFPWNRSASCLGSPCKG